MKRNILAAFLIATTLLIFGCGGSGSSEDPVTSGNETVTPDQKAGTLGERINQTDLPQEVNRHISSSNINQELTTKIAKHFVYLSSITESEKRDFIISLASAQICLEQEAGSKKFSVELANLLSTIYPGASGITKYRSEMQSLGSFDISASEIETANCEG